MVAIVCLDCGAEAHRQSRNAKRCLPCSNQRDKALQRSYYARRKAGLPSKRAKSPGHRWVDFASRCIAFGKSMGVVRLIDTSTRCADCGDAAECYDHRDYGRPFDVEPVCRSCNARRGPAAVPEAR